MAGNCLKKNVTIHGFIGRCRCTADQLPDDISGISPEGATVFSRGRKPPEEVPVIFKSPERAKEHLEKL